MSLEEAKSMSQPLASIDPVVASSSRRVEDGEAASEADPEAAEREERILEFTRDVYDQMRHFVEVPHGLVNQIYRHGLIPKKAGKDGYIRMKGPRRYHKE